MKQDFGSQSRCPWKDSEAQGLVIIIFFLGTVSKVPSNEEQEEEKSNQEKIYQELNQFKTGFGE